MAHELKEQDNADIIENTKGESDEAESRVEVETTADKDSSSYDEDDEATIRERLEALGYL